MDMKLKAQTDLSLRQSPDPDDPLYNEWHEWPEGSVFTPPAHMDVERAIERGIATAVKTKAKTKGDAGTGDAEPPEEPEGGAGTADEQEANDG